MAATSKSHAKPPGDQDHDVVVLDIAKEEGRGMLDGVQYAHMVDVEKRLVKWGKADELSDLRIEKINDQIWELKEKRGPLRKKNIRVFFSVVEERREVVVLKTYKKETEGQTPRHVIISAEDRLDDYLAGLLNKGKTVFKTTPSTKSS